MKIGESNRERNDESNYIGQEPLICKVLMFKLGLGNERLLIKEG